MSIETLYMPLAVVFSYREYIPQTGYKTYQYFGKIGSEVFVNDDMILISPDKGALYMIDFKNAEYLKLKPVDNSTFSSTLMPMFVGGEEIIASFKTIRDGVVFTTKRIFAINVQGITGKKVDYTSLPYSKIQAFSVETAGVLDLDSELELWFSGLGKVKFEFVSRADVSQICKMISERVI